MTWRMQVEHATDHYYESDVLASYNEARISPSRTQSQFVLEHHVEVDPPARMLRYIDYWGTEVCAFDVHEPHMRLGVTGRSLVETSPTRRILDLPTWHDLADPTCRDAFHEYLTPSPYVPAGDAFTRRARELMIGRSPQETVLAIIAWTHDNLEYTPGVTDVTTTGLEALELGRGVCQDFSHVALGLLRAAGIPGRYASGYLHPHEEPAVGETVAAESHAWVDSWLGEWWPVDPTNGVPVAQRHVFVAQGRDYGDVAPLKGVYHGPPSERVDVRVSITRVA